jgi:hypothetical protein
MMKRSYSGKEDEVAKLWAELSLPNLDKPAVDTWEARSCSPYGKKQWMLMIFQSADDSVKYNRSVSLHCKIPLMDLHLLVVRGREKRHHG